jgi:hypothetical protein
LLPSAPVYPSRKILARSDHAVALRLLRHSDRKAQACGKASYENNNTLKRPQEGNKKKEKQQTLHN